MAVFCIECVELRRERCLQALRQLPRHDWRGILEQHDCNLWLSPKCRKLQCSGIPALVEWMNAVATNDPARAAAALRPEPQIVILMGRPGESLILRR